MRSGLKRVFVLLALLTTSCWAQAPQGTPYRNFSSMAVFEAFAKAYPERVTLKHPLDGPQIIVGGRGFRWAEGRVLAVESADHWSEYAPQTFYEYPSEVIDVAAWPPERLALAEERLADRVSANLKRDPSFFDALWDIHDRRSADAAQRKVSFLGLQVTVHKAIREPLARVEQRLAKVRANDPVLDAFLKGLRRLEGYNWRDIAGTQSRSNHAYGTAIDLIPRSYGGRNPYWLWAPQDSPGWYRTAWSRRWQPDPELVRAFEAEGFVWGGKWLLFDTIHFEYRPEIFILNGLR